VHSLNDILESSIFETAVTMIIISKQLYVQKGTVCAKGDRLNFVDNNSDMSLILNFTFFLYR